MTIVIIEVEIRVLRAVADEIAIARSITENEPGERDEAHRHMIAAENLLARMLEGE